MKLLIDECLSGSVGGMTLDDQLALFEIALDEIGEDDLVNQVLEVSAQEDGAVHVLRYWLPPN